MFYVFEGIDYSGKSTLCQAVATKLKKERLDVVTTHAPGGTALGAQIRDVLFGDKHFAGKINPLAEVYLFAADAAQQVTEVIQPALLQNQIVLSDRYIYSGLVYQGVMKADQLAQVLPPKAVPYAFVRDVYTAVTHGVSPRYIFWLDTPYHVIQRRVKERGVTSKYDAKVLDRVYYDQLTEGYLYVLSEYPGLVILDEDLEVDKVATQVCRYILDVC